MSSENATGADDQQERPLNPWYVTGFVDAEGCFSVSVRPYPNLERPTRWLMAPVFQAYQHKDGIDILEALRSFFGCGTLVPKGPNSNVITFSVHGLENLSTRVIPHFQEYPLRTYKASEFDKFRDIVLRMRNGEHRSHEGLVRLAKIAFTMNPHGKNRKYTLQQVESGILRGHTPDTRWQVREDMVRSAWRHAVNVNA
jgi:hypothetical protein